jgi:hypothetical protein
MVYFGIYSPCFLFQNLFVVLQPIYFYCMARSQSRREKNLTLTPMLDKLTHIYRIKNEEKETDAMRDMIRRGFDTQFPTDADKQKYIKDNEHLLTPEHGWVENNTKRIKKKNGQ